MAKRPSGLRIDNPAWVLLQALVSYWGVTDANGGAGGTTLLCGDLVNQPDFDGNHVVVISGPYGGQARDISGTTLAGTVTPHLAFGGVITTGTIFAILPIRTTPAEVAALQTSMGRTLFCLDFWSDPQEEVQLAAAAGTKTLPDVTVADLPAGATIVRAIAMFKFRMIENTNAAANKLNGGTVANTSQVIQVRDDTPGTWRDAINFVDDQFGLAATTREAGDVCIGSIDIAVEVDGNDTYNFQWLLARADLDNLNFNDVQVGLRIWYSV